MMMIGQWEVLGHDDDCEISDESFEGKRLRPWSGGLYIHDRLRSGCFSQIIIWCTSNYVQKEDKDYMKLDEEPLTLDK